MHAADPGTLLNVSDSQIVQLPPSGPVNPSLQMQVLNAMEPLGDCEFNGQPVQLADPVTLLYVFSSQMAQISPFAPVNP